MSELIIYEISILNDSREFSRLCYALMSSKALEHSLDSLALTSFGVMDTTLEEVFLKVSEEDQSLDNSDAGETMFLSTSNSSCCAVM